MTKSKTMLVLATTNPHKTRAMTRRYAAHGITVTPLLELVNEELKVEETGTTLGENVRLKVGVYLAKFAADESLRGKKIIVVGDDTGLEIDALGGAPGIFVRRWKDRRNKMTDEEVISYALTLLEGVPLERRGAQFRTMLSIGMVGPGGDIVHRRSFEGVLRGVIQPRPGPELIPGAPFSSLLFVPQWGMFLGEADRLPDDKKIQYPDHRDRAIDSSSPHILMFLK